MKLKNISLWILLGLVFGTPLWPSPQEIDVAPVVKADTVFLLLLNPVPLRHGVLAYRQGPLPGGEWEPVFPDTLWPVKDYEELVRVVGLEGVQTLMNLVHAENAFDLFQKLQSPFYGGVVSLLNRQVARALARWVADPGRQKGAKYRYRVVLIDRKGQIAAEKTLTLTVKEQPMEPPEAREVKAERDGTLRVIWRYHEWGTPESDPCIGFHLYRKGPDDPRFVRLTRYPILRTQNLEYRYHDRDVALGQQYEYRLTAVNFAGGESPPSRPVVGTPVDRLPPPAPSNLKGRFVENRVVIEWQLRPPQDLAGFYVYRSRHLFGPFERITPEPLPPSPFRFEDSTGTPGTQYFYSVTAIDRSGNESRRSNPVGVIFRDLVPPDPPTEVSAEFRDNAIYITWKPSRAPDLMGYWVYRGERKEPLPRILKDPLDAGATSYVDYGYGGRGFKPGGTYFVGISALDSSRNESEVTVVRVRVPDLEPPLPVPQVDAHLQKDGSIRVVWGRSVSLDVAKYEVYRVEGEKRTLLATLPHPTQVLVDTGVMVGHTYRYAVVALDSVPNRSPEVLSEPVVARDRIPPPAPESVVVVVDSPGVRITWKPVSVPDLAGYRVYRSNLPNGRYLPLHQGVLKETHFRDPEGKPYHFYRVRAVDTSGNESRGRDRYQPR